MVELSILIIQNLNLYEWDLGQERHKIHSCERICEQICSIKVHYAKQILIR
ncbi:MAG: hypothetical protein RL329_2963 [Bacteroidota bacterium]|jgi:hypothetical protein